MRPVVEAVMHQRKQNQFTPQQVDETIHAYQAARNRLHTQHGLYVALEKSISSSMLQIKTMFPASLGLAFMLFNEARILMTNERP